MTRKPVPFSPGLTTFLLGASTVVSQSVLLREAMAAMGGSETALGLAMAFWLAGMGGGARAGVRLGSTRLAGVLPVVTLVLAGTGAVLFRAAPTVTAATSGETITAWHAVWLWALAIVPAAAAGGFAFPILAGSFRTSGPGRAYALEATGALVGGLSFSLALAPLGSAATVLVSVAAVAGALLWRLHPLAALLPALVCGAAVGPSGTALARAGWRWAGHPSELRHWTETRHQRLEISAGPPFDLYADGRLVATYPDPYTTAPRAHLLMLLHPSPKRVLAVGCTADGSVEAMILHEPDELVLVEEDPELPPFLLSRYGEDYANALARTEVTTRPEDPVRAIADERGLDLVILADGNPTTLRANRTRTSEFLSRCRSALADDGILALEVRVSDTYLGGEGGRLVAILHDTLEETFDRVVAVPGERIILVAGGRRAKLADSVAVLAARLEQRPSAAARLPAAMLPLLFDESRKPALDAFLVSARAAPNTTGHPRAVAAAVGLHEARSRSRFQHVISAHEELGPSVLRWSVGGVVVLLLLAAATPAALRATAAAGVVGFVSMGWWLLLLAVWQATRGSVYAEIGALTALFMAGVAVGGWVGLRMRVPERALPWILAAGVAVSAALAGGFATVEAAVLVPLLLVCGGLLTGAAFPGLGAMAGGGSGRRGAGRAFAADELGAAAAALVVGTVAIPWVGMTTTAVGLAILGLAAIPAARRS